MSCVDFYFDYLSPYAYLASCRVEELCARYGLGVRFRPVLFPALLDHWGQRGPAEIPPKALHSLRECLRYARLHGIPLRSPKYHPFKSLIALRVSLAAPEAERGRVVHALFEHGWARGGDLGSEPEIAQALAGLGAEAAEWIEKARTDEVKQQLRSATQAAIERGVFGIPTLDVANELFWGVDQLPYVELVLQGHDPLKGVDLSELAPRGVGAWRPGIPRPIQEP